MGPYSWPDDGTAEPLDPGQSKFFAERILSPAPDGFRQELRSLTVTAVASQHADVQAVRVTDLSVVKESNSYLGVNFNVTNAHSYNALHAFEYYIAMIVPE
ncbi:hypothetical protein ABZ743_31260 [Streptomyces sp. NPDC006662]|uniref:hypothetical protein n=1 Tax=Streptomyces sp. NPDC006662 TaxID=3156902 RepID=UPI003402B5FA